MQFTVNEEKKLLFLWLTHDESVDDSQLNETSVLAGVGRENGYSIVTLQSGNKDLCEQTEALLIENNDIGSASCTV